ncbi:MAG TPA: LuxR family transcriptional regulator [Roseiarcus sp.]
MTALTDSRLEATIERIESANDIDELWLALRQFCESHGFESMTYFAANIPVLGISNDILLSTLPVDFIQHYIKQRYCEIDPVMLAAKSRLAPFDWAELDHSAPNICRIRGEGRSAGIGRNAISAPMRGANGDSALLSVSSDMDERDWGLLKRSYMRDVQLVALSAHERFLALAGATSVSRFAPLSPRESECLRWAATGKTIEDTAAILSLSERVVRGYLDSARQKLDCVTKTQTAVRALLLGLISL